MDNVVNIINNENSAETQYIALIRLIENMILDSVSTLVAGCNTVLSEVDLSARLYDIMDNSIHSCSSLAGRISAIVEIFAPDDAVSRVRYAEYDLEQFFGALVNQMNITLGHKTRGEITFSLKNMAGNSAVFDARRICMIIYHLVTNALKHGGTDNKNIEIKCVSKKDKIEISVQDHGNGIPDSIKDTLFSRFNEKFNISNLLIGALPPYTTGLGLALCKKLTEDLGGSIGFKNYVAGARFTIVVPQTFTGIMREFAYFVPDDNLMKVCMSSLLVELERIK